VNGGGIGGTTPRCGPLSRSWHLPGAGVSGLCSMSVRPEVERYECGRWLDLRQSCRLRRTFPGRRSSAIMLSSDVRGPSSVGTMSVGVSPLILSHLSLRRLSVATAPQYGHATSANELAMTLPVDRHHRQVVAASSALRSLSLAASRCCACTLKRTKKPKCVRRGKRSMVQMITHDFNQG
jgi:hypothetical protein